jgi:hypothetical protein
MKIGKCKLPDGTIVEYSLVSDCASAYPNIKDKKYLGQGYIIEIDGKPVKGNELLHLWATK